MEGIRQDRVSRVGDIYQVKVGFAVARSNQRVMVSARLKGGQIECITADTHRARRAGVVWVGQVHHRDDARVSPDHPVGKASNLDGVHGKCLPVKGAGEAAGGGRAGRVGEVDHLDAALAV